MGFQGVTVPPDGFHGVHRDIESASEPGHEDRVSAAAAADEHAQRGGGQGDLRNRGGGEGGQGGGGIRGGETFDGLGDKGGESEAVERFGSGKGKIRVRQQCGEAGGVHIAGGGERTVFVIRLAQVFLRQIVERAVAGPGIAGDDVAVCAEICNVGDAADIHDEQRLGQAGRHGGVKQRGEWRALAAFRHVG